MPSSNLRFTVEFRNRFTGAQKTAVVDLCELTGPEIGDAMHGPGGLTGPLACAYACRYAAKKMPAEFMLLPETAAAFRVQ